MGYRFKCPGCGNTDASMARLYIPAWFSLKPDRDGFYDIDKCLNASIEDDGNIQCAACDYESDEQEFLATIDDEETTQQQTNS